MNDATGGEGLQDNETMDESTGEVDPTTDEIMEVPAKPGDPVTFAKLAEKHKELAEAQLDESNKKIDHDDAKKHTAKVQKDHNWLVNELIYPDPQENLDFDGKEEDKSPEAEPEEPQQEDDFHDDQAWREIDISELDLKAGQISALRNAKLSNLGLLSDKINSSRKWHESITGIGKKVREAIELALQAWFGANPDKVPSVATEVEPSTEGDQVLCIECMSCDTQDGDGITLDQASQVGWTDVEEVGDDDQDSKGNELGNVWTFTGTCPACNGDLKEPAAEPEQQQISEASDGN